MTGSDGMQLSAKERLSAIADGEADDAAVRAACAQWRDEPAAASTWRDYQLIGDVLRSEDLASDADHDAVFLEAFRARLAGEPVVISPASVQGTEARSQLVPARSARRSWLAPSAVAAGFLAVAGVLVLTRAPDVAPVEQIAAAPGVSRVSTAGPLTVAASAAGPRVEVASGQLIRDARLDHYMQAHKQFSGTAALGAPSAFLRNATSDASNR